MLFGKMKLLWILLTSVLLAGCAAHTDLNHKASASVIGGFKDQKLGDGVYFIEATSGMAPWSNSRGAHATFRRRAQELCGDARFSILFVYEETADVTGMRHMVTTVVGYIRDDDSPLSIDEAKRVVNEKRATRGLYQITRWEL